MVALAKDEWFPCYSITNERGREVEGMADSTLLRWKRVMQQFNEVQSEMEDFYNEAL